ncbi:hypothetical protein [Frondihabitans sp. PAMC 28766]|uniref:hypothetical protein n=1 Tax=Frondihabitans sp. PAMC 28766 TaxID=1795630 RepID=UPI0012FF6D72|nr:hypothetical protein [Frondihabitans sp. PAMC 28766]
MPPPAWCGAVDAGADGCGMGRLGAGAGVADEAAPEGLTSDELLGWVRSPRADPAGSQ